MVSKFRTLLKHDPETLDRIARGELSARAAYDMKKKSRKGTANAKRRLPFKMTQGMLSFVLDAEAATYETVDSNG